MAIKSYKSTTNGLRGMTTLDNSELTKVKPEKSLVVTLKKNGGRNNQGRITVRHQGGGEKRKYRVIDFKRNKDGIKGTVASIEYDPNRTANIALIKYSDGEKRYIIAPKGLKVGDVIESGENADIKVGNCLPLSKIPEGTIVHNVELKEGKGGQSGEVRKVLSTCRAVIGEVGNEDYELVNLGKAGRKRHMGIRPTVRGSVMNPNDHPHGGGEGRAPIGRKGPVTPWGKPALGYKTRKGKKQSNDLIIRRRKK